MTPHTVENPHITIDSPKNLTTNSLLLTRRVTHNIEPVDTYSACYMYFIHRYRYVDILYVLYITCKICMKGPLSPPIFLGLPWHCPVWCFSLFWESYSDHQHIPGCKVLPCPEALCPVRSPSSQGPITMGFKGPRHSCQGRAPPLGVSFTPEPGRHPRQLKNRDMPWSSLVSFPLQKASSWHGEGLILCFLLARCAFSAALGRSLLPSALFLSLLLGAVSRRGFVVRVPNGAGAEKVQGTRLLPSCLRRTATWWTQVAWMCPCYYGDYQSWGKNGKQEADNIGGHHPDAPWWNC